MKMYRVFNNKSNKTFKKIHKQVNEKKCMYKTVGQAAWDFVNTWSILKINRLIWNKVNAKLLNSYNFLS